MDSEVAFSLLANDDRKQVIRTLINENGDSTVSDLSKKIVEHGSVSSWEKARVALHHHHLPKLSDSHAIEYDERSGAVTLKDKGAELAPLLRVADRFDKKEPQEQLSD